MINTDFYRSKLTFADFRQAKLMASNFTMAQIRSATFVDADLSRASMDSADLTSSNFASTTLHQAQLYRVVATRANFFAAQATQTNFSFSYMPDSNFQYANLFQASFRSAYLTHVNFDAANVFEADFTRAYLIGTNITAGQLDLALSIAYATLPDGSFGKNKNLIQKTSGQCTDASDNILHWTSTGRVIVYGNQSNNECIFQGLTVNSTLTQRLDINRYRPMLRDNRARLYIELRSSVAADSTALTYMNVRFFDMNSNEISPIRKSH